MVVGLLALSQQTWPTLHPSEYIFLDAAQEQKVMEIIGATASEYRLTTVKKPSVTFSLEPVSGR